MSTHVHCISISISYESKQTKIKAKRRTKERSLLCDDYSSSMLPFPSFQVKSSSILIGVSSVPTIKVGTSSMSSNLTGTSSVPAMLAGTSSMSSNLTTASASSDSEMLRLVEAELLAMTSSLAVSFDA